MIKTAIKILISTFFIKLFLTSHIKFVNHGQVKLFAFKLCFYSKYI